MAGYSNFISGTQRRYAQPARADYSVAGSNNRGWSGGQYGYYDANRIDPATRQARFSAFSKQPIKTSLEARNPAAYQRQQEQQGFIDQYQQAIDDANENNESRYNEALGNLDGVGKQQRADINQRFDSGRTAVNQSLVDSGLANSTVLPTMRQGVERNRQGALGSMEANLARERNQIIGSRNDTGPSLEFMYQMMLNKGQGGY